MDRYRTILQASRYRACLASPSGDDPAPSITPIPAAVDEVAGSTAGASDERYLPPDAVDGWFRLAACVAAGEKDPQRRREWEEWGYEFART
ncbi:MAG: hypothetical protein IPK16_24990 [Anaerolineales bacterium]|nr:hypothetical protein [Anaerolineales bacterium]